MLASQHRARYLTRQMHGLFPEFVPTYKFLNTELHIIAEELQEIATRTDYKITLEEAEAAHTYLNSILKHYVLAARTAGFRTTEEPSTPPPSTPARVCPTPSARMSPSTTSQ